MRLFRAVTTLLMICVAISAVAHSVMLLSDSAEYRTWVYVQMSLQIFCVWLLWHVRRFRVSALLGFAALCLPLVYINATLLNYGNGLVVWAAPLLFWVVYGTLAVAALKRFKTAQQAVAADRPKAGAG